MFKHILIPTDGSTLSEDAAKHGVRFAHSIGARITFFYAIPRFSTSEVMMELLETTRGDYNKAALAYATEHLHHLSKLAQVGGVACDVAHAASDSPAGEIIKAATAGGCDLILMASHGRSGIQSVLLGSETLKVLTHSRIPVLVYR